MAPYHRFDIGFQFKKELKRSTRTFEVSVYNAYNRKNPYFIVEFFEIVDFSGAIDTNFLAYVPVDDKRLENGRVVVNQQIKTFDFRGSLVGILVIVNAVNESTYRYKKTLINYDPEFPFNEPAPLASNIEGGLGLFSIYHGVARLVK